MPGSVLKSAARNAAPNVASKASGAEMRSAFKQVLRPQKSMARRGAGAFQSGGWRPSMQGLDNGKSAWLEHNAGGYAAHSRRAPNVRTSQNLASTFPTRGMSGPRVRHSSFNSMYNGVGHNSITMLSKVQKANRLV